MDALTTMNDSLTFGFGWVLPKVLAVSGTCTYMYFIVNKFVTLCASDVLG